MGVQPATFQHVAQCLNKVRYRVALVLVACVRTQNSIRTAAGFLNFKQLVNRSVFIDTVHFSSHATNY
jgi:hypothetical protein